ncbi:MAG: hypothetical protein L0Z73_14110 [Gammaproteobacteria bacterium]|nr:hypothetical protein [Gammaproteobacteria bacterium]
MIPFLDYPLCHGYYMQWAAPQRSIIMTGVNDIYVYTVLNVVLKASSILDLSATLAGLAFSPQSH